MTHVTCRLTANNQDQLRNSTLGNRVWATFTFYTVNDIYCRFASIDNNYTVSEKKQDTKLLSITSPNVFRISLTDALVNLQQTHEDRRPHNGSCHQFALAIIINYN